MAGKPDFRKEISLAMKEIPKRALRYLRYLILTSKSEGAIEDLLSFRLHKSLQEYELTVAREFSVPRHNHTKTNRRGKGKSGKRVDIAILASEGNVPVAAIEITRVAKATVAASIRESKKFGLVKVKNDLETLGRWREARANKRLSIKFFGLLVVSQITRSGVGKGNVEAVKSKILSLKLPALDQQVSDTARKLKLMNRGAGSASLGREDWFGATVSLQWWLFSLR